MYAPSGRGAAAQISFSSLDEPSSSQGNLAEQRGGRPRQAKAFLREQQVVVGIGELQALAAQGFAQVFVACALQVVGRGHSQLSLLPAVCALRRPAEATDVRARTLHEAC